MPKLSFEERIQKKLETIENIVRAKPNNSLLVTTELGESHSLAKAIEELEEGLKNVRLRMGSPKLSFEEGQEIIAIMQNSVDCVRNAIAILNHKGFGVKKSVVATREAKDKLENKLKEAKNLESEEMQNLINNFKATIEKEINEEIKIIKKHKKLKEKIEELTSDFNIQYEELKKHTAQQRKKNKAEKKATEEK